MTNGGTYRTLREQKTVEAMVSIYCHGQHGTCDALCPACSELREYARRRLGRCPFREKKPTCANCSIHCYKPDMRVKIKQVMRYAGPRMIYRSPILAFFHFLDGFRKLPGKKRSEK
ncbi:MAG: nitrous oxide-stimulated promoter family protein [Thermodesulfovibrionales bacterium]|nr:nitrous oxide-stimulated promoter family protein [Thermodesulfovibrionales bacterium]